MFLKKMSLMILMMLSKTIRKKLLAKKQLFQQEPLGIRTNLPRYEAARAA